LRHGCLLLLLLLYLLYLCLSFPSAGRLQQT
jgi:hypothetical protein